MICGSSTISLPHTMPWIKNPLRVAPWKETSHSNAESQYFTTMPKHYSWVMLNFMNQTLSETVINQTPNITNIGKVSRFLTVKASIICLTYSTRTMTRTIPITKQQRIFTIHRLLTASTDRYMLLIYNIYSRFI